VEQIKIYDDKESGITVEIDGRVYPCSGKGGAMNLIDKEFFRLQPTTEDQRNHDAKSN
jgi:hypothetical protein